MIKEKKECMGPCKDHDCKKGHMWLGLFFIFIGMFALYCSFFTSVITVMLLGSLLACAGVGSLVHSFLSHTWKGVFSSLLFTIFAFILGFYCVFHPFESLVVLTPSFALFFLLIGVIRMFIAGFMRMKNWGWGFFSGLLAFAFGFMILLGWPVSSLWALGVFVGADLFVLGLGMMLSSRRCSVS